MKLISSVVCAFCAAFGLAVSATEEENQFILSGLTIK